VKRTGTLLLALFSGVCFASHCEATVYHSDGSAASVQALHNAALNGDTITLPAGTFTWTTGVTISKAIEIQGAGSGRIIGRSRSNVAVGTGSKTFTTQAGLNISAGNTLRIESMPLNNGTTDGRGTWMQGTVMSYSGTSLVMNVTSSGGSGTHDFWKIETIPATTISHGTDANTLFTLNESTAGSIELTGIRFAQFSDPAQSNTTGIRITSTTSGQPVLIHDCWFSEPSSNHIAVLPATNQGVVWSCSFDASPFAYSTLGIQREVMGAITAWITPSTWGAADTTGRNNFYFEDCDFHAYLNFLSNDDNSRTVLRHCVFDNAGMGSHGADTSPYGQRHFEIYDSEFVFNSTNGDVLNLNWWVLLRGGTFLITDCIMADINSQDYSNKSELVLAIYNLDWNVNNGCWGAGTPQVEYYCPRQVGMGNVTGIGHDGLGRQFDSVTYVGDPEPIYVWNITGMPTPGVDVIDSGQNACSNPDSPSSYIQPGRDYFLGTAKPGYQKFVYPHPLRNGGATPTPTPTPTATATATPTATVSPTPTPTPASTPTPTPTATATATATPTATPTAVPIRINCGGPAYLDHTGQPWSVDMDFVGGLTFSTTESVTGTSDPTLYQTERYAPTLRYNIPVVNGTYTVTLYFAEIFFNAPGQRVFSVSLEGQIVVQNFDIWAVAGQFAAVQRSFVVTVTDGVLNIVGTASVNNAKFSAIQVVPGSSAPTPTPSPTVTPTPTPTPTQDQCEVPNFIDTKLNHAQSIWNDAGFTTEVIIVPNPDDPGQGKLITWQSLPQGFIGSCSDTTIAVTSIPQDSPMPIPTP